MEFGLSFSISLGVVITALICLSILFLATDSLFRKKELVTGTAYLLALAGWVLVFGYEIHWLIP